jgi:hypothetical protein
MPETTTRKRSAERTEFLSDVLCAALEGGIGYWSQAVWIIRVHETEGYPLTPSEVRHGDAPWRYDAVTLFETADGDTTCSVAAKLGIAPDDSCPGHRVTLDTVAHGIAVLTALGASHVHASYRVTIWEASAENDAGEIDADLADMIVQAGVFGEVIYG